MAITHRNEDRARAIRQSHLGQEMRAPIANSIEQTFKQLNRRIDAIETFHNERLRNISPVSDVIEFDPAAYYPKDTILKMPTVETGQYYRLTEPHPVGQSWGETKKERIYYMTGKGDHMKLVVTRNKEHVYPFDPGWTYSAGMTVQNESVAPGRYFRLLAYHPAGVDWANTQKKEISKEEI